MKNLLKSGRRQKSSWKKRASGESTSTGQQTTDLESLEMVTKSSNGSPYSNVYQTCQELPLDKFMTIVVEDRIDLLLKDGEAPMDFLLETWLNIYTQYSELVDERFIFSLQDKMDIEQLKGKIMVVGMAVEILSKRYDEDLVQLLKDYGFDFSFPADNLVPDLNRVVTLAKAWVAELSLKEADLSQPGESKKPGYDQFYEVLEVLSKDAGYGIRPYDLTVYEYASRVKRFIKRMQKQKQNERTGS